MFEDIRRVVAVVPAGQVVTYGGIARSLGLKNSRVVGWALHQNKDSKLCPCQRVVDRNGKLAKGYAFGGAKIQKTLLEQEGVTFLNETTVDLDKHLFIFP